jgi:hypothetical protein
VAHTNTREIPLPFFSEPRVDCRWNSRLDQKIDSGDKKLNMRIDELDKRWDEAQRLAVIEGKVHELESRG